MAEINHIAGRKRNPFRLAVFIPLRSSRMRATNPVRCAALALH
jgi:hypothetical protein